MSKHIVFLLTDFSLRNSGGIGTYVETMATGLTRLGHRVTVVVPRGSGRAGDAFRIVEVQTDDACYETRRIDLSYRLAEVVGDIHRATPINIVEATDYGLEGLAIMRRGQFPLVVRLHTPDSMVWELNGESRPRDSGAVLAAEGEYFMGAKYLTAPSNAMKREVARRWGVGEKRIEQIPNPSSLVWRGISPQRSRSSKFAFFGRLERRKGVYVLADALRHVLPKRPQIEFEFIGANTRTYDGSVGSHLKEALSVFSDRVRFCGHLVGENKFQRLACCDCVVLPSLWENYPYACLEAMAFGKPVLATRNGGFEEIIQDGLNGRLVEPNNAGELAEAMLEMIELSFPSLEVVNQDYLRSVSPTVLLPRFEAYYRQVEDAWN